jgi:hypothetical protein
MVDRRMRRSMFPAAAGATAFMKLDEVYHPTN